MTVPVPIPAGRYVLRYDMVVEGVTWFEFRARRFRAIDRDRVIYRIARSRRSRSAGTGSTTVNVAPFPAPAL